eukprot:991087_1
MARSTHEKLNRSNHSLFWDAVLLLVGVVHIALCPFTKVEESFNVQATHDILFHQWNVDEYDHLEFSGVVPRTFVGPLFLGAMSSAWNWLLTSVMHVPKVWMLGAVRLTLLIISLISFSEFRESVARRFNKPRISSLMSLITATQFHLLFYMSRPLPNIFALCCVMWAYTFWLRGKSGPCVSMLAFTCVVFRCDAILVAAPILLCLILENPKRITEILKFGVISSALSIGATIAIDSFFWKQKWMWPEFQVLWFNTVDNRSSEWGTSPWHWYHSSCIPRAMLAWVVFVPVGLLRKFPFATWKFFGTDGTFGLFDRSTEMILLPAVVLIDVFSFLPHKELRFVFYAFPLFNAIAAIGVAKLLDSFPYPALRKGKKKMSKIFYYISRTALIGVAVCSGLASLVFLRASSLNYPGGKALMKLHKVVLERGDPSQTSPPIIHIGNVAAISGVSRFLERPEFRYSKLENVKLSEYESHGFAYLLSEKESIPGFAPLRTSTGEVEPIEGFSGLDLRNFPHIFRTKPTVYLLERRKQKANNMYINP